MDGQASILVVDDHPLFRGAVRQALSETCAVSEAEDFGAASKMLEGGAEPDLVLLDLSMPGVRGFSGLLALRAEYPSLPVVIVSGSEDAATVRRSLDLGAAGFIPKSSSLDTVRDAVDTVLAGGSWKPADLDLASEEDEEIARLLEQLASLTPQQSRVLGMLSQGLLNKQIAYELSVSEATVKAHVSAVLSKLEVDSRTQAVIQMAKLGADGVDGAGTLAD